MIKLCDICYKLSMVQISGRTSLVLLIQICHKLSFKNEILVLVVMLFLVYTSNLEIFKPLLIDHYPT